MRFYFFDGTAAKGPYTAEELSALPGFGAESIVCPVGAQEREDWKPAVAYEPLKNVLFKPLPLPTLPRPILTKACPQCSHRNEDEASFCNRCGTRLSGEPAPAAVPISQVIEPAAAAPSAAPSPAQAPAVAAAPSLSDLGPQSFPRLPLPVLPPLPSRRPWKTYIVSAVAVAAAFYTIFIWLGPKKKKPAEPAHPAAAATAQVPAPPAPSAAVTAPPPAPAPAQIKPPPAAATPPPAAAKPFAAPLAPQAPPKPPRAPRAAKPKPKQTSEPQNPEPVHQTTDAATTAPALPPEPAVTKPEPPAAPSPASDGILLPGMPSKIQRPSAAPATDAEKLALDNAREQFEFCHQLMRQKAFGDVFDTCLCRDARKAPPFNGSRDAYINLSQAAASSEAGKPRPSFDIVSAKLQNANTALITASWKSGKKDPGRQETETWLLEDGLWCLQP